MHSYLSAGGPRLFLLRTLGTPLNVAGTVRTNAGSLGSEVGNAEPGHRVIGPWDTRTKLGGGEAALFLRGASTAVCVTTEEIPVGIRDC